jgi:hypothetical protein
MPDNQPYTPDQRPQPRAELAAPATLGSNKYEPESAAGSSWITTDSSNAWHHHANQPQPPSPSSRYPTEVFTPTKIVVENQNSGNALGTPYTPTSYSANSKGKATGVLIGDQGGLAVVREQDRPVTTFSDMMERAGWRRSGQLVAGLDPEMRKMPW